MSWREKPLWTFISRRILRRPSQSGSSTPCATLHDAQSTLEKGTIMPKVISAPITAPTSPNASVPDLAQIVPTLENVAVEVAAESVPQHALWRLVPAPIRRGVAWIAKPIGHMVNPIMISIAISLPIALVPTLKALFVDASASGGPRFSGPDGRPPLAFLIDTGPPVVYPICPMS